MFSVAIHKFMLLTVIDESCQSLHFRLNTVTSTSLLTLYQTTNILSWFQLKAFADDKLHSSGFFGGNGSKHCGKRKKAGYQHFLVLPQCFQKFFLLGSLCVVQKVNSDPDICSSFSNLH